MQWVVCLPPLLYDNSIIDLLLLHAICAESLHLIPQKYSSSIISGSY